MLVGGAQADLLTGGVGIDIFRFGAGDSGGGMGADRITDFVSGVDIIDVTGMDDTATIGDQAFTFIGGTAFSGTVGELRNVSDSGDTRLQADTNGDSVADFEVVLSGALAPIAADFIL